MAHVKSVLSTNKNTNCKLLLNVIIKNNLNRFRRSLQNFISLYV